MNIEDIVRLLQNSGIRVIGADAQFIYIEDPSCILRGLENFLEYAWIAVIFVTMLLLSGWAVSLLRGAKNDIFTNLRNLIIIFATLGAVGPIMVAIWGRDYIAKGCKTINVSISAVNSILDMRNNKLSTKNPDDIWEEIDIFDSGAPVTSQPVVAESPNMTEDKPLAQDNPPANNTNNVSPNLPLPISASIAGKDVIYIYANGTKIRKTGGTGTWRNNNQGNISYGKFAQGIGALAKHGRWAVFPTEESGMEAIKKLLNTSGYKNLSIAAAIARWAPPSENDTARYQRQLGKITQLDISRPINSLNEAELNRVANAIKTIEGFKPGREIKE